jgi:hypothetical protein
VLGFGQSLAKCLILSQLKHLILDRSFGVYCVLDDDAEATCATLDVVFGPPSFAATCATGRSSLFLNCTALSAGAADLAFIHIL